MLSVFAFITGWIPGQISAAAMLAQETVGSPAGGAEDSAGLWDMLPLFAMMALVFYFMLIRPQRKQTREHAELLASIQKHDNVRTTGGIVGKVAQVDADHDLVILTIDESKNVRMRVARQSVVAVLSKEDAPPTIKEEDNAR
ncbi:MAG: preprotein translocase subunit YajC [Planctomycetota bacterium]|nr:preprotein translocase subunit YajC [Planctomycetota bacterium]